MLDKVLPPGAHSCFKMNDGPRWRVVTVFWQAEDDETPLPDKYLKAPQD
ncbi:MAG TPA: hypothetical protein VF546_05310 [Pyrinomonadaceae bacterium]|jgi:hypothetical protein